jgi:flagellar protein FlgJ
MDLPPLRPTALPLAPARAPLTADDPALLQAAQGFEALILTQMLQTARAARLGEGLFEGTGSDTTNGLLDRALADAAAGRAGLGLAETIARQLAPLQARAAREG